MAVELTILNDLVEATEDILLLGNAESFFSIEEVLNIVFKFYGAIMNAVVYCVITPEEAQHVHFWLVSMFELSEGGINHEEN